MHNSRKCVHTYIFDKHFLNNTILFPIQRTIYRHMSTRKHPIGLTSCEIERFKKGLKACCAFPFIDSIEDYVVEALLCYVRNIAVVDPFFSVRSKQLFDVVDNITKTGWSVKSIQIKRRLPANREFELVIQRADVLKKQKDLGFSELTLSSDPNTIGAALLRHWKMKVDTDSLNQGVTDKRVFILLKHKANTVDRHFYVYEAHLSQHKPHELTWKWSNDDKSGLQGIHNKTGRCIYRWYPSQKQLFERFVLPKNLSKICVNIDRLKLAEAVDMVESFLQARQG